MMVGIVQVPECFVSRVLYFHIALGWLGFGPAERMNCIKKLRVGSVKRPHIKLACKLRSSARPCGS